MQTSPVSSTVSLLEPTARLQGAFAASGLRVIAKVWASQRAIDLALLGPANRRAVVRCAELACGADYSDLANMLAQGDFDRAALVYTAEDQPYLSDEIETYPLSRIDELAASLAKERMP